MASASKTPSLNLPQWVGTEKPERTDFNAAFDAIDTTVASHLAETVSQEGGVHGLEVEVGTWTPIVTFNNVEATHSANDGSYTKIGNKVDIVLNIRLLAKGSGVGQARIKGLPFTSRAGVPYANFKLDNVGSMVLPTGAIDVFVIVDPNSNEMSVRCNSPSVATHINLNNNNFNSDAQIRAIGTYYI